jgi:hypothetical protein
VLGFVAVLGGIFGLVSLAWREKEEPALGPAIMRARLAALVKIPASKMNLAQASDGVVLSRRLGERELEQRFARDEARLRHLARIAEKKQRLPGKTRSRPW